MTAPDDGVITARTVTVGQIAQAGAEMLRLLRDGRIEWRGEVPEARLAELKPGQTRHRHDGRRGRVQRQDPRRRADDPASTVRDSSMWTCRRTTRLRPGMFARGDIEIDRTRRRLPVPLESVVSADGYSYVFVLKPRQHESNVAASRRAPCTTPRSRWSTASRPAK